MENFIIFLKVNTVMEFEVFCYKLKNEGGDNGNGNEEKGSSGWFLIKLENEKYVIIKMNESNEIEEVYLLSRDKLWLMVGENKTKIVNRVNNEDSGEQYDENDIGHIPLGFSCLFDENGNWRNNYFGNNLVIYDELISQELTENRTLNGVDISPFLDVNGLNVGDNHFGSVNIFVVDGWDSLKLIIIGKDSFTKVKSGDKWDRKKVNNPNRSFHILNCDKLESIEIGQYSFSDYGGEFELINLPILSKIKIGEIGSNSYNFYWSSFEIKGIIEYILIMNRSSTIE